MYETHSLERGSQGCQQTMQMLAGVDGRPEEREAAKKRFLIVLFEHDQELAATAFGQDQT